MKLPRVSFLEKKEQPEYYLALILRNEKANAVILEQVERKLRIVSEFEESFEDSIETATTEDFLNVLDKAISKAEDALPASVKMEKTIFGLKASWVFDNKIKKEYLDKLKKACNELALSPIGFLILNEAIISLIQKEEGAPITALLAEVGKKHITVSFVKAGKVLETKSSEIHESASYTVDAILKHLESPEILPSRLIVFDASDSLVQEFISHQWSKSLSFLHLPQIVNLNLNFDANAMLIGAAAQMGLGVIQGFSGKKANDEEIPELTKEEFLPQHPLPKENIVTEQAAQEERGVEQLDEAVAEEFFGFVTNKDIAKIPISQKERVKEENIEQEIEQEPELISEEIEQIPETIMLAEEKKQISARTLPILPKLKSVLGKVLNMGKKIPAKKPQALLSMNFKGKQIIFIPILIAVLLIVGFFLFIFDSHATVTLSVKPDISEKNQSVTFSTSSSTDIKKNVIAADFVSVSEDGTDSTPATGTKDVGDKAKGVVTIFSQLSESQTLPKGTVIKSPNGLSFILDSAVTISSVGSHSADQSVTPSTANINVTAGDIGKSSNLPSGTKFTISGFATTDLVAKNDNPFSGGTSKTITVISKDDIAKLLTDLPKKLEDKAKNDITGKLSNDKALLPNFVSKNVGKKDFDKNAGEEATQVTLTGAVSYQGVSYNKNDIVALALNLFSARDITINKDDLNVNVKDMKAKDKEVQVNLNIQALLLPKVDDGSLTRQIAGQSVSKAQNVLSKLSHVSSVTISVSPSFPFLPKNLPRNSKNIKIVIKLNG
ncbi:MAG: baseplate J/gp47 family protein [Patescibacteria group bacterium]|nr:baseplate J/gp47 family protein [Patescibacteria group bacterium]